ncbi:MAG TPA: glycosyltransferase family 2 protein [Bacteroidia bacterium]|nr:glycosyltransferase family 2 protein [Bacteroidia bacterium]
MTNSNQLVSVVIPCFNAEAFFRPAIESILNQTYHNLEIILLDDGSTDSTPLLLEEYRKRDSRIRVIVNPANMGLIKTLNNAIDICSGEYLARMDADDISMPDRIEKIMKKFDASPELDIVSAGFYYISEQGKVLRSFPPMFTSPGSLKFVSFFRTPIVHACLIGKTRAFIENKYNQAYIHSEDYELFSRMLLKGNLFANITDCLYQIRMNSTSVSYVYSDVQKDTHTRISFRNIKQYLNTEPDMELLEILNLRLNSMVVPNKLKMAIAWLDEFRTYFLKKEVLTTNDKEEIKLFCDIHQTDMILQALKSNGRGNKKHKFSYLRILIPLLLKPHVISYLNEKYQFRNSQK